MDTLKSLCQVLQNWVTDLSGFESTQLKKQTPSLQLFLIVQARNFLAEASHEIKGKFQTKAYINSDAKVF